MKYLLIAILFLAPAAYGQCVDAPDDRCVSVRQSTLDRLSKALDEYAAAKVVIETQAKALAATDVERAAVKNAFTAYDNAIAVFQKGVADRDKLIELQDRAIQAVMQLNEKLIQQMGKKPSAWSRFLNALKTVTSIAFGIGIGRGL